MIYHPATGPKSNVYVNDEEGYVYLDQDAMDSPVGTIAYYELIVEGHEPIRLTPDQAVLVNWLFGGGLMPWP